MYKFSGSIRIVSLYGNDRHNSIWYSSSPYRFDVLVNTIIGNGTHTHTHVKNIYNILVQWYNFLMSLLRDSVLVVNNMRGHWCWGFFFCCFSLCFNYNRRRILSFFACVRVSQVKSHVSVDSLT